MFKKGDRVRIIYQGREGVIDSVHDEEKGCPYRVRLGYGVYEWCGEEELEHV